MNKKYYWLKLNIDFFDREEIKLIEGMPNGKDYIIFYMKLLLKSTNTDGRLMFKDIIPYTDEMLATITNTNIDVVRSAVKMFIQLGMMEKLDDGALFMIETQNMIGCETEYAKKKREYREKMKQGLLEDKTEDNIETKKDIVRQEKEIELDKDIDKETTTKIDILNKIEENPDLEDEKDSSSFFEDLEKDKIKQIKSVLQMHGISVPTCKNIMELVYSKHIDLERIKEVLAIAILKKWEDGAIYKALKEKWITEDKKSYNTEKTKSEKKAKEAIESNLKNKEQRDKAIEEKENLKKIFETLTEQEKRRIEQEALKLALEKYPNNIAQTMARTETFYDVLREYMKKQRGA